MEVILAKTAGFCFGVKRAMDIVFEQIRMADEEALASGRPRKPIYTYGPLIHNEEVVADLEARGVRVAEEGKLSEYREGVMILRSHGVGRAVQEQMEAQGLQVVDATCPFVKKIHRLVQKAGEENRDVVIIGDPEHPEVRGIMGWCREGRCHIVESAEDVRKMSEIRDLTVVSQTTFNHKKFQELVEIIRETGYNIIVVNTICNATQERQIEARKIAEQVGTMVVIGGQSSSNTQKLYDICKNACPNTYYIQTLVDLGAQGFAPVRSVGITAGASTPDYIIQEVHTYVRSKL